MSEGEVELNVMTWRFRCVDCGSTDHPEQVIWRCPSCDGELTIDYPDQADSGPSDAGSGLWRWADSLPVAAPSRGTILGEGDTPLVPFDIEGVTVHLKLDSLLPTGSFKDRGAAMLSQYLKCVGVSRMIVDSSGNAAASMAAYAAAQGLECIVYVPANASPGKLVQARAYGARVIPVEGSREDVATAAQSATEADDTASYASHNWHPIFVEGVKTWALEVRQQLGDRNPDKMFIPTGGGSAFVGAWRGFVASGSAMPELIACQPLACAPIVEAWNNATPIAPADQGQTIAEGARIAMPSRPGQIQQALRESGGRAVAVDEDMLTTTLRLLWSSGFYVEPTGALGIAACRLAIAAGDVKPGDTVVAHITGHGLKSTPIVEEILLRPPD